MGFSRRSVIVELREKSEKLIKTENIQIMIMNASIDKGNENFPFHTIYDATSCMFVWKLYS